MRAVDTNILVYAHRREGAEHERASELLEELAEGEEAWAIPWPCIYEFFSVVTNARIWKERASTPSQAWEQIAAWTSSPTVRLLSETDEFVGVRGVVGCRVTNAMTDVLVQQTDRDALQRLVDRADLREDVDAVRVLVDQPLQAPHLALDASQSFEVVVLVDAVAAHAFLPIG